MGAPKIKDPKPGEKGFEQFLVQKANWLRVELLKLHKAAPETRVASSLSNIEIITALYYGGILTYDASNPMWDGRDRFVISKGHGSIAMYPLMADVGYFPKSELQNVCKEGSFLGGIPDPIVPGYETVNGSLGHGLGVACGMALAMRVLKKSSQVFCMIGDGEMHEGSIWEAIMFASHHQLDNLTVIVDKNQKCMLDYTEKVIKVNPIEQRLQAFGYHVVTVNGHDPNAVRNALLELKPMHEGKPKVLVAETVKGKGAPKLEASHMCHVVALSPAEIDEAIARLDK